MELRGYDPDRDAAALWSLKAAFERELGTIGGDGKAATYEGKLTDAYRERYLSWVERCITRDPDCVTVVAADAGTESEADAEPNANTEPNAGPDAEGGLVGYVFVLPADLAMIWDAAVVNEVYVRESVRGTGLADDLLDAAYACARAQDLPVDRIALDVGANNDRAASLYRRHGFEPWGTLVARDL